jgi:hypothetical protein
MARRAETQTIDGVQFTVQQLPAMRSMKLMHKLAKALGPAMLKAVGSGGSLKELNLGNAGDAAQMLFEKFSADDFEALIRELLETALVTRGGSQIPLMPVFDDEMCGKPDTVLKLLRFALSVNYQSFWKGLSASVAALVPQVSPSAT